MIAGRDSLCQLIHSEEEKKRKKHLEEEKSCKGWDKGHEGINMWRSFDC